MICKYMGWSVLDFGYRAIMPQHVQAVEDLIAHEAERLKDLDEDEGDDPWQQEANEVP